MKKKPFVSGLLVILICAAGLFLTACGTTIEKKDAAQTAAASEKSTSSEALVTPDATETPAVEKEDKSQTEAETKASSQKDAQTTDSAKKTIGEEKKDSVKIKLANVTGKDISCFSIEPYEPFAGPKDWVWEVQEELIHQGYLDGEPDGVNGERTQAAISSYRKDKGLSEDGGIDDKLLTMLLGAGYDENMLSNGDVFANDETRYLYVPPVSAKEKDKTDADDSEGTDDSADSEGTEDPVKSILATNGVIPEYIIRIKFADDNTEYMMYIVPLSMMDEAEICYAEPFAFLQYKAGDTGKLINTLALERAAYEAINAADEYTEDEPAGNEEQSDGENESSEDEEYYEDDEYSENEEYNEDEVYYEDDGYNEEDEYYEDDGYYDEGSDGAEDNGVENNGADGNDNGYQGSDFE